ncbi:Vegetative incompatibility protein [Paramyrothecium foliicola]|nr:Vegetative incompatibility protein [Paramyrothecium foliicola]
MRLINVKTLDLEEYFGNGIPPYAILSHTWGREEVSFQEWNHPHRGSHKSGYGKILLARAQAIKDELPYLWVDTVCIDKGSSAELSEAINSMFAWYHGSILCYAYLVDVSDMESLHASRWFTRGWTLQELLAPKRIRFFNQDWRFLGRKPDLCQQIAKITRIRPIFVNGSPPQRASVAERMSWLSRRSTTRVEDMAYCMLGIFGLSIPLLYGEGTKAFLRLQEEIIRVSNDHSIFCWSWIPSHVPRGWRSVIAPSPAVFEHSRHYKADTLIGTPAYSITNAGLSIALPLAHSVTETLASLPVVQSSDDSEPDDLYSTVAIPLAYDDSHELFIRSPYPPHPIQANSELFAAKQSVMIDARNSPRNAHSKFPPAKLENPNIRHGVLIVLPLTVEVRSKCKVLTINGHWDSSTSTFWLEKVGRDDFAAGILSIVIRKSDGDSDARRLTVFFTAQETSSGEFRASVRKFEMQVENSTLLRDWPPEVRRALQPTIQDSVVMAETHGASWSSTTYSIEADATVSISSGLYCFRDCHDLPVSICEVRPGRCANEPDSNRLTRRKIHRTKTNA